MARRQVHTIPPTQDKLFTPPAVKSGYVAKSGPAPDDAAADRAWVQIMEIARKHALIVQAYGGVATLAIPSEQRKAGIREQTLRMELFELETEGWTK